jgi:hypothetical protein
VVRLTIGLNFVKKVDKNWKKHVQSLDRMIEERNNSEIYIFRQYNNKIKENNINNDKSDWDYWDFWKKRYLLIR